ncbi:hypothetical protein IC615_03455 [Serratia ureilytica]
MHQIARHGLGIAERGRGARPFEVIDAAPDQMQMQRFAGQRDGEFKAGGHAGQTANFRRVHGAQRHRDVGFALNGGQLQGIAVKRQPPVGALGAEVGVKKLRALVCGHDDSSKEHGRPVSTKNRWRPVGPKVVAVRVCASYNRFSQAGRVMETIL